MWASSSPFQDFSRVAAKATLGLVVLKPPVRPIEGSKQDLFPRGSGG